MTIRYVIITTRFHSFLAHGGSKKAKIHLGMTGK